MADPGTLLLIGSTAMSAMSAISQGQAQAATYKSEAQAAQYNAIVERQNANQVSNEYNAKQLALQQKQGEFLGRQRAALAESGIGQGGSAGDIMAEDTTRSKLDDLTLQYEGLTKRTAALNSANLDTYQSKVASMNAGAASTAGTMGALGAVIGGAGRYYDFANKTRLFT